jgi:Icc-related predicted phosphoesterase/uncharacterized protein YprB with RNaseH-like and TPR domain
MRIAAFSDWRVQPFEPLHSWLNRLKPDLILYAGDDTVRLGGFTEDTLQMIADAFENDSTLSLELSGMGEITEDITIERNTTLIKFRKSEKSKQKHRTSLFLRRRMRDSQNDEYEIWIGPPPRTRGTCIHYRRRPHDWMDRLANTSRIGLAGVVGNDCYWNDRYRLKRNRTFDLHDEPLIIDKTAILGLEGSPLDIGIILYEEDDALEHLEEQFSKIEQHDPKFLILVTHAPPKGVLDLSRRFGIDHIGSEAVRKFIESRNVNLVICGHSHINGGKMEQVGDCVVINISSHDYYGAPGRVCSLEVKKNQITDIEIEVLFEFESALDNLHKLGPKRAMALYGMGITELEHITEDNRNKMAGLHGIGDHLVSNWIVEAKALLEMKAYRIQDPIWNRIDLGKCLVYDIETDIYQDKLWCIGVYDSSISEMIQFWEKDDEKKLLKDFFRFVRKNKSLTPFTYSATKFDQRIIEKVANRHGLRFPKALRNEIDIGWLVVHRTLGTPKGGLKSAGPFFGYEWQESEMSGVEAGMLYSRYLKSKIDPPWEKLLQYNRDDVLGSYWVLKSILALEEIQVGAG